MDRIILICFILLVNGISYGQSAVRATVQKTYLAEIGVREATGHNDGARVEEYLKSAGSAKGNAWCAAFICWTLKQAQATVPSSSTTVASAKVVRDDISVPNSPAWSPSWFPADHTIYSRSRVASDNQFTPLPGDVFGLYFESKKRIAHVGFVDEWGDEWVITVEGNTNEAGSREGDGVYKKRRPKRTIYKVSRWIND